MAQRVAAYLGRSVDDLKLYKFADGESLAEFPDASRVKGKHVHIL